MKRLIVHLERCTGCNRCEVACVAEHIAEKTYVAARAGGATPIARILVEAGPGGTPVPLVCRHCHEPLCVSACMSGCMQKDPETGIVTNMGHEQPCVGCWMCVMSCPYGVITPSLDAARLGESVFPQALKCDFCPDREVPACVAACPMGAIEVLDD